MDQQAYKQVPSPSTIRAASSSWEMDVARLLLGEYAAHLHSASGAEHICLESYDQELASLPGVYAAPQGTLLLAFVGAEPAGCVAMKPLSTRNPSELACEMKRLWVRPRFRGLNLGTTLTEALIQKARAQNYTALYLDTLPAAMKPANHIYSRLGFEPCPPYRHELSFKITTPGAAVDVAYFRLDLAPLINSPRTL